MKDNQKRIANLLRGSDRPVFRWRQNEVDGNRLAEWVHDFERKLIAAGVKPHAIVGVAGFDSWTWIGCMLTIWKYELTYVPVTHDSDLLQASVEWLVELDPDPDRPVSIRHVSAGAISPEIHHCDYLFPTSGSMGNPKWIKGTLSGLCHFIDWESSLLQAGASDVVSLLTPPTFDPVFRDVLLPLFSGGILAIPDNRGVLADARACLHWMTHSGVTITHVIPTVMRLWCSSNPPEGSLSRLRAVLSAGEPLFGLDVRRFRETFGTHARMVNLYGPSETTLAKFAYSIPDHVEDSRSIPVGKPIPGATMLILGDKGEICLPGTEGEVLIRTPYSSLGYWNQPELTARSFIENPFRQGDLVPIYRTGDLGALDSDGNLTLSGRKDAVAKLRGVKISLSDIETSIRGDGGVMDCAVALRNGDDGQAFLAAYVVTRNDNVKAIKQRLAGQLKGPCWPQVWLDVPTLPRTRSGKIDRNALPAPLLHGDEDSPDFACALHKQLLDIWKTHLPWASEIGIHDDFVFLGGQSIEAVKITNSIQEKLGARLSLQRLYELGTIAAIAAAIQPAERATAETSPMENFVNVAQAGQWVPLTGSQARFWRWIQDEQTETCFQFMWAARIGPGVSSDRLRECVTKTLEAHDAVHLEFSVENETPRQRVRNKKISVELLETKGTTTQEKLEFAQADARERCSRHFEFATEPLARAFIYLVDEFQILVMNNHVLASDGWTKRVLLKEIRDRYEGSYKAEPVRLGYCDYVVREQAVTPTWKVDLDFWRHELAGLEKGALLPLKPSTDRREQSISLLLGKTATAAIRARASGARCTVAAVHLAVVTQMLARRCGRNKGHLLISNSRRGDRLVDRMVGSVTDSMVFRYEIDPAASFDAHVSKTHNTFQAVLEHSAPTFDYVMGHIHPDLNFNDRALFPVIFAPQPNFLAELDSGSLPASPLPWSLKRCVWPLEVYPIIGDEETMLRINYMPDVFSGPDEARKFLDDYRAGLESYASDLSASATSGLDCASKLQTEPGRSS